LNYFKSQGWTHEQAAGIVANLAQESRFNPAARGDAGKAQGIAQWHADRRAPIERHFGKPISQMTYQEQLQAVQWEMTQGGEKRAGQILSRAHTAAQAGAAVSRYYERPKAVAVEMADRGASAARYAAQYPREAPAVVKKAADRAVVDKQIADEVAPQKVEAKGTVDVNVKTQETGKTTTPFKTVAQVRNDQMTPAASSGKAFTEAELAAG